MKDWKSEITGRTGVRGKLDLMSNIDTIMDNLLWVESARETHKDIIQKSYFIMDLLFFKIIILFHLFPYLEYYYFVRHFEMRTVRTIHFGCRGDEPRVALSLAYYVLKVSSGYQ